MVGLAPQVAKPTIGELISENFVVVPIEVCKNGCHTVIRLLTKTNPQKTGSKL